MSESLLVVIDLDEAMDSILTTNDPDEKRCDICQKGFNSVATLARHLKQHKKNIKISDEDIKEAWESSADGVEIPEGLMSYFRETFRTKTTGSDLMHALSCDGLTLPSQYPGLSRAWLLQTVRKVFDSVSVKMCGKKPKHTPSDVQIIEDEVHIIQYIGGYILQRLKKRCRDPDEYSMICGLIHSESESGVSPSSLIAVLQNRDFGTLTVPMPEIMALLKSLERKFRKGYDHNKVLATVLKNMDLDHVTVVTFQNAVTLELLEKICRYYLKIRCFQKARVLNSDYSHDKDQNISQRKSLKTKSGASRVPAV